MAASLGGGPTIVGSDDRLAGAWRIDIGREASQVHVTVEGRLSDSAVAVIAQVLEDLIVGQGNAAVSVGVPADAVDLLAGCLRHLAAVADHRGVRFRICAAPPHAATATAAAGRPAGAVGLAVSM